MPRPPAPKSTPTPRAKATEKAVVLFDGIRYIDADGTAQDADKGDEVTLSADEFKRLSKIEGGPAVAAPKSKDAKQAQADADADPANQPPPLVEPEPEPDDS